MSPLNFQTPTPLIANGTLIDVSEYNGKSICIYKSSVIKRLQGISIRSNVNLNYVSTNWTSVKYNIRTSIYNFSSDTLRNEMLLNTVDYMVNIESGRS